MYSLRSLKWLLSPLYIFLFWRNNAEAPVFIIQIGNTLGVLHGFHMNMYIYFTIVRYNFLHISLSNIEMGDLMLKNIKRNIIITIIIVSISFALWLFGNIKIEFDMGETERITNYLPIVGIGLGVALQLINTCISRLIDRQTETTP